MKTAQIFPIILISTTLLTSACTPPDKAVTDSKTRSDIQAQNVRKSGGGRSGGFGSGQKKTGKLGDFQLSALLMEKQIEAIEMVRLALQIDNGSKSNVKLKDKVDGAAGYSAVISLDPAPLMFVTSKGDFESKVSKNLNVSFIQEPGQEGWGLRIVTDRQTKQTVDLKKAQKDQKAYVNFMEKTYELVAESKSQELKEITIELKTSGYLNGSAGVGNYDLKLSVTVDKESLRADVVKIITTTGQLNFTAPEGPVKEAKIAGKNQELKAVGLCNTLLGSALISSDFKKRKVEFTETQVRISETSFKWDLAECGKRPTVDLSRLLP